MTWGSWNTETDTQFSIEVGRVLKDVVNEYVVAL